jgi:hypothetical protein
MDKLRPDTLEILEHLGRTNEFPTYLTQEEVKTLLRSWEYTYSLEIPLLHQYIKEAYKNYDNELLTKVIYILMGFALLESKGYGFGSTTPFQKPPRHIPYGLNIDDKIVDFILSWISYNGGNYYILSGNKTPEMYEYLMEKLEYLKNRDLKKFMESIEKAEEKAKIDELERKKFAKIENDKKIAYQRWTESQIWYPTLIHIKQTKENINNLEGDIYKLERELRETVDSLEHKISIQKDNLQKFTRRYNRLKLIAEISEKHPSEILNNIIESDEHIDIFEPLADKITIEDIKKLDSEKFNKLIDKLKVSGKKSKFRKLYKELTKTAN